MLSRQYHHHSYRWFCWYRRCNCCGCCLCFCLWCLHLMLTCHNTTVIREHCQNCILMFLAVVVFIFLPTLQHVLLLLCSFHIWSQMHSYFCVFFWIIFYDVCDRVCLLRETMMINQSLTWHHSLIFLIKLIGAQAW